MNALFYGILLISFPIHRSLQGKPTNSVVVDDRPFSIRIVRLKCVDTPYKLIDLKVCKVKLRRNEPTLIFLEFDMPTLLYEMHARFTVNYKLNTYQPLLIDLSYEVCAAMRQKPGVNAMYDYVFNTLRALLPQGVHPCPYGGRYYNLSNFSMDEKYLPKTIPAGDYRIDFHVTDKNNITMMNLQGYMAVRSTGIASLSMLDW